MNVQEQNGQGGRADGVRGVVSFGIVEVRAPTHGLIGFASALGMRAGRYRPELLDRDLDALADWGSTAMLCLMESGEVEGLAFEQLSFGLRDRGIGFVHLPIPRDQVPDARFDRDWERLRPRLLGALCRGQRLMVQCSDGCGRSGIAVGRLLIDAGMDLEEAIAAVREARPEALACGASVESVGAYARGD